MKDSGGCPCRVQGWSPGLQHCLPCTILTPTEVQSLYPLENKKRNPSGKVTEFRRESVFSRNAQKRVLGTLENECAIRTGSLGSRGRGGVLHSMWTLTWQEGASAGAPKPPWPFSGAFPPMHPSSQEVSDCGVQFLPSKRSRHCKHACMCAHVHTHAHTSVHTPTCTSVHTGTCTQPLTCVHTHSTWARTQHPCMHVSVQVHTQAHVCTRTPAHMHAHAHAPSTCPSFPGALHVLYCSTG